MNTEEVQNHARDKQQRVDFRLRIRGMVRKNQLFHRRGSFACGNRRETHAANAPAVGFHDEIVLRFVLSCEVVAAGLEEHSVQLQYAFFAERNVRITAVDKV